MAFNPFCPLKWLSGVKSNHYTQWSLPAPWDFDSVVLEWSLGSGIFKGFPGNCNVQLELRATTLPTKKTWMLAVTLWMLIVFKSLGLKLKVWYIPILIGGGEMRKVIACTWPIFLECQFCVIEKLCFKLPCKKGQKSKQILFRVECKICVHF